MNNDPGKQLDEVCNDNNEVYREEVLYESWADVSHGLARVVAFPVAQRTTEAAQDIPEIKVGRYACRR